MYEIIFLANSRVCTVLCFYSNNTSVTLHYINISPPPPFCRGFRIIRIGLLSLEVTEYCISRKWPFLAVHIYCCVWQTEEF